MRSFILAIGLVVPALAAPSNVRRSAQLPSLGGLGGLGGLGDLMGGPKPPAPSASASSIAGGRPAAPSAAAEPEAKGSIFDSLGGLTGQKKPAVPKPPAPQPSSAMVQSKTSTPLPEEPESDEHEPKEHEHEQPSLEELMAMGRPKQPSGFGASSPPSSVKRSAQLPALPGLGALDSFTGKGGKDSKKGSPIQGLPVGKRQLGGLGGLGGLTNGLTGKDDKPSTTEKPEVDQNKEAASKAKAISSPYPSIEPLITPGKPGPMKMPGLPELPRPGPPPQGVQKQRL